MKADTSDPCRKPAPKGLKQGGRFPTYDVISTGKTRHSLGQKAKLDFEDMVQGKTCQWLALQGTYLWAWWRIHVHIAQEWEA